MQYAFEGQALLYHFRQERSRNAAILGTCTLLFVSSKKSL